jgi:O-antigen/teichoic acid export membrane protein
VTSQAATLVAPRERQRPALAGAWLVSGAMVLSGVLTYAFQVLAARTLGPHAYGQIGVLWAAMFLAAIMIYRPLEQTSARAIADRLARGEEIETVLRSVGLMAAASLVVLGAATAAAWRPLTDRLFLGDGTMTAMLVAGIAAYGVSYLARGLFGGARWFGGYGLILVADSIARLAVAAPLVVVASKDLAAAAVVAAGIGGALVPLAVARRRVRPLLGGRAGSPFRLRTAASFAAPAGLIAGADQLLVNGAPLLVIVGGGRGASGAAGVVFAATMLVRVPVYVFQGFAASLLPNLTHLAARDDAARFRGAVARTAAVLLGGGACVVVGAAALGPGAMGVLYGSGFEAGRVELALLGAGVACYLAASTFSQALLALDAGRRAAVAWTAAAVLFAALYAVLPGDPLFRIALAFALAAFADLVLLGLALAGKVRTA